MDSVHSNFSELPRPDSRPTRSFRSYRSCTGSTVGNGERSRHAALRRLVTVTLRPGAGVAPPVAPRRAPDRDRPLRRRAARRRHAAAGPSPEDPRVPSRDETSHSSWGSGTGRPQGPRPGAWTAQQAARCAPFPPETTGDRRRPGPEGVEFRGAGGAVLRSGLPHRAGPLKRGRPCPGEGPGGRHGGPPLSGRTPASPSQRLPGRPTRGQEGRRVDGELGVAGLTRRHLTLRPSPQGPPRSPPPRSLGVGRGGVPLFRQGSGGSDPWRGGGHEGTGTRRRGRSQTGRLEGVAGPGPRRHLRPLGPP